MNTSSLVTIAGLLLASLTASADIFTECTYDNMTAFAVQNSILPGHYGEPIVRTGGGFNANQNEAILLSSLVSSGGHQEIEFIKCDPTGHMTQVISINPDLKVLLTAHSVSN